MMKKVLLFFFIAIIFYVHLAYGTTYYVRSDGGTGAQCNGLANAPYKGSGDQNCAWNHPFWALNSDGSWKLKGGDTLIIGSGSYEMGMGAPNTEWCGDMKDYDQIAFSCFLPPLPSGTPQNPTRILGEGYDAGCKNPPELWGNGGVYQIINLEGTSHAEIQCLNLTDHSSCGGFRDENSENNLPMFCSYPVGDYARTGIFAVDSSDVLLKDLDIHGFADSGIVSARLSNIRVENVRLAANGFSGWNGDTGEENTSNSGRLILKKVIVEWNGCPEEYPSKKPANCFAQEYGGFGDGIGLSRTGGEWIVEDSIFRYNVQDGLDFLYVGVGHSDAKVRIERSLAYGNGGNQLKVGGNSTLINNLVVGNCDFFYNKPFAPYFSSEFGADHCRAGGGAVVISLSRGNRSDIVNNTVAGYGWALFEVQCVTKDFEDQPPCDGSERVNIQNNIIIGDQDRYVLHNNPGEHNLSDLLGDGCLPGIIEGECPHPISQIKEIVKFDYNVIYNSEDFGLTGSNDIIEDPLVRNPNFNNFDGHLKENSPAIDSGLPVGGLNNLVPSIDIDGITRPQGNGVDRGAYEFTGTMPDGGTVSDIIDSLLIDVSGEEDGFSIDDSISSDIKQIDAGKEGDVLTGSEESSSCSCSTLF